ncbi:hypothetical protein C9374_002919 [Naegleria lovaniensis]|uniref:Uncharacterized protein n=1 Tax=Naegleria lovaniensis TaxID=51637 RepID=A0AA88GRZ1_NAELO|nr:uncharacterized protein C9374_002919 [Naegleria lovaniensis]KAG2385770.1 hypothetical protein C9374_002919 [Naegleria lovaniensis]
MNADDFLMDFLSDQMAASTLMEDATPTALYEFSENEFSDDEKDEEQRMMVEKMGRRDDDHPHRSKKNLIKGSNVHERPVEKSSKNSEKGNADEEDGITLMMMMTQKSSTVDMSHATIGSSSSSSSSLSQQQLISLNPCAANVQIALSQSPSSQPSAVTTGSIVTNDGKSSPPSSSSSIVSPTMLEQSIQDGLKSVYRGYRNGIVTGVRIRIPYILQSLIYATIFQTPTEFRKVRFVIKQMFHHGKNLGSFVGIYKLITYICRNQLHIRNGIDSWIAGFIGGYVAFGESKGISGAVNNQIVLYLFARGIDGGLRALATNGYIPEWMDITTPVGFRLFAGFSLALILYLTDYQPSSLRSGFMTTMEHLYHESNKGTLRTEVNFAPFVTVVTLCLLLGYWFPQLRLDNVLQVVDDSITWNNVKKFFSGSSSSPTTNK